MEKELTREETKAHKQALENLEAARKPTIALQF